MHVHGKLFFSKGYKKFKWAGENISNMFFNPGYVFSKYSVRSMNTIYFFKIHLYFLSISTGVNGPQALHAHSRTSAQ